MTSRREFLRHTGLGFGSLALTGALADEAALGRETASSKRLRNDLTVRRPDHRPKAKAIIQLFQNGGPSQMDLFDPKPELTKRNGQPHPGKVETFQLGNRNVLLKTPHTFKRYGESGMHFSNVLPHMSKLADEWCMVRSMFTTNNNHPFAINMIQTGNTLMGRPALGSWIGYALGSENQNLPGYVVLRDPGGYNTSGKTVWSNGWLPAIYQGTEFNTKGDIVHHLKRKNPLPRTVAANNLQLLADLNRDHQKRHPGESVLDARILNFEMAARMQLEATTALDISKETAETRKLYGLDNPKTAGYGTRCLMARRLIENGVRFVQIFPPLKPSFQPWDNHGNVNGNLITAAGNVDQASAALVWDLKRRGLLDDVIVMWTGEFGRLPITENANGRDHNRNAWTLLMAGGGFRKGLIYGATDEFGYKSVEKRVSVPDLHATILHQMGIDHTRLSYRHAGRDERLTDPEVTGARIRHSLLV